MLSLQIGPLALPTGLVLLFLSLCVAYGVAWWLRRYRQLPDGTVVPDDAPVSGSTAYTYIRSPLMSPPTR